MVLVLDFVVIMVMGLFMKWVLLLVSGGRVVVLLSDVLKVKKWGRLRLVAVSMVIMLLFLCCLGLVD